MQKQECKGSTLLEDTLIEIPSQRDCLPQKITDCSMIVGISVENSEGGRDSLTSFAMAREMQNRTSPVIFLNGKGKENCKVLDAPLTMTEVEANQQQRNESKAAPHQDRCSTLIKGIRNCGGVAPVTHQDLLLECSRPGRHFASYYNKGYSSP